MDFGFEVGLGHVLLVDFVDVIAMFFNFVARNTCICIGWCGTQICVGCRRLNRLSGVTRLLCRLF